MIAQIISKSYEIAIIFFMHYFGTFPASFSERYGGPVPRQHPLSSIQGFIINKGVLYAGNLFELP